MSLPVLNQKRQQNRRSKRTWVRIESLVLEREPLTPLLRSSVFESGENAIASGGDSFRGGIISPRDLEPAYPTPWNAELVKEQLNKKSIRFKIRQLGSTSSVTWLHEYSILCHTCRRFRQFWLEDREGCRTGLRDSTTLVLLWALAAVLAQPRASEPGRPFVPVTI